MVDFVCQETPAFMKQAMSPPAGSCSSRERMSPQVRHILTQSSSILCATREARCPLDKPKPAKTNDTTDTATPKHRNHPPSTCGSHGPRFSSAHSRRCAEGFKCSSFNLFWTVYSAYDTHLPIRYNKLYLKNCWNLATRLSPSRLDHRRLESAAWRGIANVVRNVKSADADSKKSNTSSARYNREHPMSDNQLVLVLTSAFVGLISEPSVCLREQRQGHRLLWNGRLCPHLGNSILRL